MIDLWDVVWNYDTYEKGGEYSASDIVGSPLMAKLRHDNPDKVHVETKDKIAAQVGTAIHSLAENAIKHLSELPQGVKTIDSEVKVKYRTLSGTMDLLIHTHEGYFIGDWKTGKQTNINNKLNKPEDWVKQLSIYRYLLWKQEGIMAEDVGYIFWYCTDTQKYGTTTIDLMPLDDVSDMVREFMEEVSKPVEELDECELCLQFKHRWCGVRSICPAWNDRGDKTSFTVEDW